MSHAIPTTCSVHLAVCPNSWTGIRLPVSQMLASTRTSFFAITAPPRSPHLLVTGTNHPVEVTNLSLQMVRSDRSPFHAGLVVDKLALWQACVHVVHFVLSVSPHNGTTPRNSSVTDTNNISTWQVHLPNTSHVLSTVFSDSACS